MTLSLMVVAAVAARGVTPPRPAGVVVAVVSLRLVPVVRVGMAVTVAVEVVPRAAELGGLGRAAVEVAAAPMAAAVAGAARTARLR